MNAPNASLDPRRCPLCGGPNGCAMEQARVSGQPQTPCWCTQVAFDAAVLARVPAAAKGRACVCAACASAGAALVGDD